MSKKKIEDADDDAPAASYEAAEVPPDVAVPVGRVCFEDVNGEPDGEATYDVPADQRERLLVWRYVMREQQRQLEDGTWVYRAQPGSGPTTIEHDAALTPIAEKTTKM